jgi:hypothetical protein
VVKSHRSTFGVIVIAFAFIFASCNLSKAGLGPSIESNPPVIDLITPALDSLSAKGFTLSGTQTISGTAKSDVGLAKVELKLGTKNAWKTIQTQTANPGTWTFEFDTSKCFDATTGMAANGARESSQGNFEIDYQIVATDLAGSASEPLSGTFLICPPWAKARASVVASTATSMFTSGLEAGSNRYNVKDFGAKGDGITDDTAAFQKAIDSLPASMQTLYVPAGTYMIDAVKNVMLRSEMVLLMDPNAVLKAMPNADTHYVVLNIESISNVAIVGGNIVGERNEHQGTGGEWGYGIRIAGSNNVLVRDTKIRDCWGDGMVIMSSSKQYFSSKVDIVDLVSENNRRQGISIGSGRDIAVIRASLGNTNGTPPQAGIDLEPDNAREYMQNIHLVDLYTYNNRGSGILVALNNLDAQHEASIVIENQRDTGSMLSLWIAQAPNSVGKLIATNCLWFSSRLAYLKDKRAAYSTVLMNCFGNGKLVAE